MTEAETCGRLHCLHPKFLAFQLDQSRRNLGLDTVDLLYIHNPYEMHGPLATAEVFMDRLKKAFEFCEQAVRDGKVRNYGLASFLCFRSPQNEEQIHLSLQRVVHLAESVGGKQTHHFRFIQAPLNMAMPEAMLEPWQSLVDLANGTKTDHVLLAAANRLSINLISCQPLFQGKAVHLTLSRKVNVKGLGARHLQFIRSIPARCLLSTLVGMKTLPHVRENLDVATHNPLTEAEFRDAIQSTPIA